MYRKDTVSNSKDSAHMTGSAQKVVLSRLIESFDKLDQAIINAKQALVKQSPQESEVLRRLDSYQEIVRKQRSLAMGLHAHAAVADWDEVSRHLRLINGLSEMIRDDAQDILTGMEDNYAVIVSETRLTS